MPTPRSPQPGPAPAGTPYRTLRPVPVRPEEAVISATLEHATGRRPTVLLSRQTLYLDTRAGSIATGNGMQYQLAAGTPIILARRDALTLAEWRRTLTQQPAGQE